MWIYIIIIFLTIFVIFKERQALGCPNIPDGRDCDNANGKAVKGTSPNRSDSISQIFEKLKLAGSFADRWVVWRLSFVVGITSTLLCFYIMNQRLPTEWELIVCSSIIMFLMYFCLNFYDFHLFSHIKQNISDGVELLKSKLFN